MSDPHPINASAAESPGFVKLATVDGRIALIDVSQIRRVSETDSGSVLILGHKFEVRSPASTAEVDQAIADSKSKLLRERMAAFGHSTEGACCAFGESPK